MCDFVAEDVPQLQDHVAKHLCDRVDISELMLVFEHGAGCADAGNTVSSGQQLLSAPPCSSAHSSQHPHRHGLCEQNGHGINRRCLRRHGGGTCIAPEAQGGLISSTSSLSTSQSGCGGPHPGAQHAETGEQHRAEAKADDEHHCLDLVGPHCPSGERDQSGEAVWRRQSRHLKAWQGLSTRSCVSALPDLTARFVQGRCQASYRASGGTLQSSDQDCVGASGGIHSVRAQEGLFPCAAVPSQDYEERVQGNLDLRGLTAFGESAERDTCHHLSCRVSRVGSAGGHRGDVRSGEGSSEGYRNNPGCTEDEDVRAGFGSLSTFTSEPVASSDDPCPGSVIDTSGTLRLNARACDTVGSGSAAHGAKCLVTRLPDTFDPAECITAVAPLSTSRFFTGPGIVVDTSDSQRLNAITCSTDGPLDVHGSHASEDKDDAASHADKPQDTFPVANPLDIEDLHFSESDEDDAFHVEMPLGVHQNSSASDCVPGSGSTIDTSSMQGLNVVANPVDPAGAESRATADSDCGFAPSFEAENSTQDRFSSLRDIVSNAVKRKPVTFGRPAKKAKAQPKHVYDRELRSDIRARICTDRGGFLANSAVAQRYLQARAVDSNVPVSHVLAPGVPEARPKKKYKR